MSSPDQGTNPHRRRASIKIVAVAVLWLAVVVAVTVQMIAYSNAPGSSGTPPAEWPAQSQIPLQAGLPTLVMFAHPRCPCTRASVGELERFMAGASGRLAAHVLFLKPAGTEQDWAQTDLWRAAAAIPGVTVHQDDAGVEARRFHSETSGHTLLYDVGGRLMFQGGITLSRGHAGDNPGRSALAALLDGPLPNQVTTPVFGCSMFEADCQEGGAESELRNPNSRNPKEGRNPKPELKMDLGWPAETVLWGRRLSRKLSGFGLRISFGSRISNFGFRTEGNHHP